jgi:transposase
MCRDTLPFAGDVFVFRSKRADRLQILLWDGSGLVLLSKRLERGRFTWPPVQDGAVKLSAAQLTLLFSGVGWSQVVLAGGTSDAPDSRLNKLSL